MLKNTYNVISVMSGTSLDGIDLIYATYTFNDNWKFIIHNSQTLSYPKKWKLTLKNLVNQNIQDLKNLNNEYSIYLGNQVKMFINTHSLQNIDFISSHGHTALHQPDKGVTYQIGNLQSFADTTGRLTICDFRVQDVEFGGQGAPLVPIGDKLLFNDYDYCLNLGGFANISYEGRNSQRMAFDICPVNIVLNKYVSFLDLEYDEGGKIAEKGSVQKCLLTSLNQIPFYTKNPPKSLGLEWVKENIFPKIDACNFRTEDILRTFVEHIAIQISKYLNRNNTSVYITGGGAYNDFLITRIKDFSVSKIVIPEPEIVEFKEALVFGLLGILKVRNEINCLKSVTGASQDHSSGKILFPSL